MAASIVLPALEIYLGFAAFFIHNNMVSRGKMMLELTLKKAKQRRIGKMEYRPISVEDMPVKTVVPLASVPEGPLIMETMDRLLDLDEDETVANANEVAKGRTSAAEKPMNETLALDGQLDVDQASDVASPNGVAEGPPAAEEEMNEIQQEEPVDPKPKKRRRTLYDQKAYNKDKFPLLDGCKETCRKKCQTKFTRDDRMGINDAFWSLSFSERRLWLDSHILVTPVKTRRNVQDAYSRTHSIAYSLPHLSSKVSVCKVMFLRTLGKKTDAMVTEFLHCKDTGSLETLLKDKRGSAAPKNKKDKDLIRDHINSFHPQVSHYKLANAPHRRYLDPTLTITSMWEDYKSKYGEISYIVYQRVFQSENIGFGKPWQDDCDVCAKFKAHLKEPGDAHGDSPAENDTK